MNPCGCAAAKVDYYMEGPKDCLTTDYIVPAWAARVVARADQSYFQISTQRPKAIIIKTGPSMLDFDVLARMGPDWEKELVEKKQLHRWWRRASSAWFQSHTWKCLLRGLARVLLLGLVLATGFHAAVF